jgi:rare lipoprotein A
LDNNLAQWQKLPTVADLDEGVVSAQTVLPFSRVALFAVPDTWAGEASWYKYKNCNCAASRDYPKGTALRVTCLSNSRSVDVVVNDFGPELWTGRLIDLDAVAFAQLGSLRWGVTDVKIELLP